jgi:diaminopimelate decarboxylase
MRLGELLGGRAVILCALTPDFAAADFARTHPLPPVSVPTPLQQELLPKAIAMLSDEVPCALYFDLDAFEATLRDVKQSFPPDTMHAIAMKANPLAACLLIAKELGFGCEVASPAELEHAMRLGFTPDRIVMDSPAKTRRDLRAALAAGVLLNADNLDELVRIDEILASEYGGGGTLGLGTCRSRIGIRVNPQLGEGSIAATGTIAPMSKFGVPLTEAKAELLQSFGMFRWLTGVHCHVGSQGCGLELLVSGARAALALADEINAAAGRPQVTLVDVGGGLPADYASDEPDELMPTRLTPGRYAAALRAQLPGLLGGGRYTVVTEFGRYASAKCALTISKVEYVKRAGGRRIATVHCGADLFLRTAYQPANWPHRVSAWDADGNFLEPAADGDVWDVVGPLCFRGDIVAQGVRLTSRLQSGHFVCVHDTGAYTLAMFSKYNSRQAPPAYGVRNGGRTVYQIASGETVDDALRLWQLPLSHPQAAAAGCERRAG